MVNVYSFYPKSKRLIKNRLIEEDLKEIDEGTTWD